MKNYVLAKEKNMMDLKESISLGNNFYYSQNFISARFMFKYVIKEFENYEDILQIKYKYINTFYYKHEFDKAESEFKLLLESISEKNELYFRVLCKIGSTLYFLCKYDESINMFTKILNNYNSCCYFDANKIFMAILDNLIIQSKFTEAESYCLNLLSLPNDVSTFNKIINNPNPIYISTFFITYYLTIISYSLKKLDKIEYYYNLTVENYQNCDNNDDFSSIIKLSKIIYWN